MITTRRQVRLRFLLDDTNLPWLWSVEGLARLFRGVLGLEKGLPELKICRSGFKIMVDESVRDSRPFIASFVAEGRRIDDNLLEQLIQLQEKFCEGYGRKREKVSIGMYSHKKIKFPVHYRAAEPDFCCFHPSGNRGEDEFEGSFEEAP